MTQGWAQVIRFDAFKQPDQLTESQQVQLQVCDFANTLIDAFNTNSLGARLECVRNLWLMTAGLTLAAFLASVRKLPRVEPTQLTVAEDGQEKPLFYVAETVDRA